SAACRAMGSWRPTGRPTCWPITSPADRFRTTRRPFAWSATKIPPIARYSSAGATPASSKPSFDKGQSVSCEDRLRIPSRAFLVLSTEIQHRKDRVMAKRILVPLDLTEDTEAVAPLVADLARGRGATVRL